MAFKCVVVTPEQQVFDETIVQAIVPVHDGQIGILTGRAPLLVKLGAGELRLDLAGGKSRSYFIDGGIAQMKDNVLTILTTDAMVPTEIDLESARAEEEEAKALRITDQKSYDNRQHRLARAKALQSMARGNK
jgi:F-type H+-transporting ATPase subunit epsilon